MASNSAMSNGKEAAKVNGEPVLKRARDGLHELLRSHKEPRNKVTVVLGAQWGDEGKGKVVDLLAMDADIVCRCQVWRPDSHVKPRKALVLMGVFVLWSCVSNAVSSTVFDICG